MFNYETTMAIPISIISKFDAYRELLQEQQQNLDYEFNILQLQQANDQKTESIRGNSLALFVAGLALIDFAVALISLNRIK